MKAMISKRNPGLPYVVLGAIISFSALLVDSSSSSSPLSSPKSRDESIKNIQNEKHEGEQKHVFHFNKEEDKIVNLEFFSSSATYPRNQAMDRNDTSSERSLSTLDATISRNMNEETEYSQDNSTTTYDLDFYDPDNKFDRYRLEKALNDPRSRWESAYTSSKGARVATVTGTISAISSLTLIYIIMNSLQGLTSVYHRIIFGLSCHDIFLSIAIAFTTMPMPTNMIYQHIEGLVLGNQTTCNVQGFFFTVGANSTLVYTLFLFVYYLLSIRYKMTNDQLSKRIEPVMHFFCNVYGLVLAIIFLVAEAYNPTPFDTFCTTEMLPYWCPIEPEGEAYDECVLRTKEAIVYPTRWIMIIASVLFGLVTLISFPLIIHAIYKQEKMLKAYCKQNTSRNDNRIGIIKNDYRFTRKIAKEALMYLLAFVAVNIFSALSLYTGNLYHGSLLYGILHMALRPLQGFFNLCIFVYHKYEHLKRRDENITFKDGLVEIFRRKRKDEQNEDVDDFIVSSLSIVEHDIEKRERAGKAVDQEMLYIEEHSKRDASTQINMIQNKQDQEEEKEEEEVYAYYGKAFRPALNDSDSKTSSNNISPSNQESSSRNTQSLALEEFVEDGVSFASPHTNRDDVSFGQDSRFSFDTFVRSLKSNQNTKNTDNKSNDNS